MLTVIIYKFKEYLKHYIYNSQQIAYYAIGSNRFTRFQFSQNSDKKIGLSLLPPRLLYSRIINPHRRVPQSTQSLAPPLHSYHGSHCHSCLRFCIRLGLAATFYLFYQLVHLLWFVIAGCCINCITLFPALMSFFRPGRPNPLYCKNVCT